MAESEIFYEPFLLQSQKNVLWNRPTLRSLNVVE